VAILKTKVVTDTSGLKALSSAAKKRTVTQRAVKAGAKIVQRAAKAAAPKRKGSGALKQSVGIKAAKGRRGKTLAYAVVGPRKKVRKTVRVGGRTVTAVPAFYAHLVEKGTRPHSLTKGAKLARRGRAAAGQGRVPQHPGARPNPFLGPAFTRNRGPVAAEVKRVMAAEVEKEVKKAAAKLARKTMAKGRR
jgi:HK97 gp10 family phage protein